jgi:hypothetical protein
VCSSVLQAGLGYLIVQKNFNFDIPGVFVILLVLSLLGIGLHLLISCIQRRVVFWVHDMNDCINGGHRRRDFHMAVPGEAPRAATSDELPILALSRLESDRELIALRAVQLPTAGSSS